MNVHQARQLLLLRAIEVAPLADAQPAQPTPPLWTPSDAQWADAEALRQVGEASPPDTFLAARAALAVDRIAERDPALARLRQPTALSGPVISGALLALVLIAGLATDAVGPSQRVNLLAPPLLAVMAWNLAVYFAILVNALRGRRASAPGAARSSWAVLQVSKWMQEKLMPRPSSTTSADITRRFTVDWAKASQPLIWARMATVLHLAAIAVAAGALFALYARGLVFEFKAGWDSTFLGADFVHRWLDFLLAPAQAMSGLALPDATHIETLRFSNGDGENAARWIHWYAITTGLIMLPRAALAALSLLRAGRLQRNFPLPLDDRYFQRLLQQQTRAAGGHAQMVLVLPYGMRMASELQPPLDAAIDSELGPGLRSRILPNTAPGGEDDLADDWPATALGNQNASYLLALFALSATPERETHGAFVLVVKARAESMPGHPQWRVMIDESGFRQRLAEADMARRLADRRLAWQKLLNELGAGPALFVDLGAGHPATA